MANTDAQQESVLPYFFAGVWGFAGCIMMAMGSHPPAAGTLVIGGQFLVFHALATMAVATQVRFGGIYKRAAIALLLVGSGLFAAEIAIHAAMPGLIIPLMAPLGGLMAILGWLCIAIGAIRTQKS